MRVAIVHQSDALADVLERALRSVDGWDVAWRARDARAAVENAAADRPDVLLLQVSKGAVEATREIMHASPCAIVLMLDRRDEDSGRVFEAMSEGALDVVMAPSVDDGGRLTGTGEILGKVKVAARLARWPGREKDKEVRAVPLAETGSLPPLVVVGASTGGPAALVKLLAPLPKTYPAAIVVVQHVAADFCAELAGWLGRQVGLTVKATVRGDRPAAGIVMLAGGNDDLEFTRDLELTYRRPRRSRSFYHPSVDAFFTSAAMFWPSPGLAVLLTGIGRDGADGLSVLRKSGWTTIAQDEATSVVYGMPKAAVELGAASQVLPIGDIARLLGKFGATAPVGRNRA
jgi:two-component system response regulator WspF